MIQRTRSDKSREKMPNAAPPAVGSEEMAEEHGPIHKPVDRFGHLPEPVREFLESLREEDIKDIEDAIRLNRTIRSVGRFFKWLIITVLAIFVGAVQFGEAVQKILVWIARGGGLK